MDLLKKHFRIMGASMQAGRIVMNTINAMEVDLYDPPKRTDPASGIAFRVFSCQTAICRYVNMISSRFIHPRVAWRIKDKVQRARNVQSSYPCVQ